MDNLTRMEQYWQGATNLANGEPMGNVPDPLTREEQYFKAFLDAFAGYINTEKQIYLDLSEYDVEDAVDITEAFSVADLVSIAESNTMPDMVAYIEQGENLRLRLIATETSEGQGASLGDRRLVFACPAWDSTTGKPIGVYFLTIYRYTTGSQTQHTYARYYYVEYAEASE